MAEAISIPSPSVFLRNSPPRTASEPKDDIPPAPKNARRQGAATKKAPARKQSATIDGATKPKQSKSRNGMLTALIAELLDM